MLTLLGRVKEIRHALIASAVQGMTYRKQPTTKSTNHKSKTSLLSNRKSGCCGYSKMQNKSKPIAC